MVLSSWRPQVDEHLLMQKKKKKMRWYTKHKLGKIRNFWQKELSSIFFYDDSFCWYLPFFMAAWFSCKWYSMVLRHLRSSPFNFLPPPLSVNVKIHTLYFTFLFCNINTLIHHIDVVWSAVAVSYRHPYISLQLLQKCFLWMRPHDLCFISLHIQ